MKQNEFASFLKPCKPVWGSENFKMDQRVFKNSCKW